MPRSAKGWQALRCCTPSPAPRGRCARRSGEEEGREREKKKIRLGAGAAAQGGQRRRCPRRCPPRRRSSGRSRGACVCLCFTPCECRSSSSENRAVSSRERTFPTPPPPAPPSSFLVASADYLLFWGVVFCSVPRQEGRERSPSDYAKDFLLLQNALKRAEVLAYIQLHTSVNLSLCGVPQATRKQPPKISQPTEQGGRRRPPRGWSITKITIINPSSRREKANTGGTNQMASLPTGPEALSPP